MSPRLSILTATYNRAHTLERLRVSIEKLNVSYEWIIVDDGSTDGTADYLRQLSERSGNVRVATQSNSGRHVALNRAVELATAPYAIIMDSDDWLYAAGVETLIDRLEEAGPKVAAAVGLCDDQNGRPIGSEFPAETKTDFATMRFGLRVRGDKKEIFRTTVLKSYPFPTFGREKRVPTSLVLNRMSQKYECLVVNSVVCGKEYLPDGLTKNIRRHQSRSPNGSRVRYAEFLDMFPNAPLQVRIKNAVQYARYSFHAAVPVSRQFREIRSRVVLAVSMPAGFMLFQADKGKAA